MPRILVWNINALAPTVPNFVLTHGSLRGFFDSQQADIVCFQETKLIEEKLTKELACVDGYESFWAFSQTKKGYSGVATYAKAEWAPVAAELDALGTLDAGLNGEGRCVLTDHGSFVLINVYVPNAGKRGPELSERADLKVRFLHALKARADALVAEGRQVVLVGDFNIAVSSKDVHARLEWGAMYHPEELAIMRSLLESYTDVWRLQHPETSDKFTVFDEKTSARAFNQGVRIDYVLVSPGLLGGCGACEILETPPKWSDHLALTADLGPLAPSPPHAPIPQSSARMKRFDTRSQPSVASLFKRKAAAAGGAAGGKRAAAGPSGGGGGGGPEAAAKRQRGGGEAGAEGAAELGDSEAGSEQTAGVGDAPASEAPAAAAEGSQGQGTGPSSGGSGGSREARAAAATAKAAAARDKGQPGIAAFFTRKPQGR